MKSEAGILQQRVKALTVKGCRINPLKRVGSEQNKQQKADTDQSLYGKDPGFQTAGQMTAKSSNSKAEQCQNPNPQKERSFMIAPDATDFIQHRFKGMRVFHHIQNGEIAADISHRKRNKSNGDGQELHE